MMYLASRRPTTAPPALDATPLLSTLVVQPRAALDGPDRAVPNAALDRIDPGYQDARRERRQGLEARRGTAVARGARAGRRDDGVVEVPRCRSRGSDRHGLYDPGQFGFCLPMREGFVVGLALAGLSPPDASSATRGRNPNLAVGCSRADILVYIQGIDATHRVFEQLVLPHLALPITLERALAAATTSSNSPSPASGSA